jgi:hypothetical protein
LIKLFFANTSIASKGRSVGSSDHIEQLAAKAFAAARSQLAQKKCCVLLGNRLPRHVKAPTIFALSQIKRRVKSDLNLKFVVDVGIKPSTIDP